MQPPNQSLQCLRRSNTFVFCLFLLWQCCPACFLQLSALLAEMGVFVPWRLWFLSRRRRNWSRPPPLHRARQDSQREKDPDCGSPRCTFPGALAFLPVLLIKGALLLMGSVFKRWTSKNKNAERKQTTQYFGEEPLPQTRNYFSKSWKWSTG